jgi:serpin B
VSKYFQAEASNLNFANSEASLKAINGCASKQTNGLIPKVLDDVSPSILAYLLNALYFKSEWTNQFPKSATGNEAFVDENGEKRSVEMMKMDTKAAYFENDEYQAVRMPYGNGAYSMTVYLPKEGNTVSDITAMLKKEGFRSLAGEREVDLWFPKFETKFKIQLKDILSEMGMPIAFAGADFSAMASGAASLAFVQQDAVIKVDEEGSEAAAVSVAAVEKSAGLGGGKAIFHADHTFFYIISEKSTGAVLFAGRYSGK